VKAVQRYNSVPLGFDLGRFPRALGGEFTFQSVTQLVASLPCKLRETPHAFEFNCYDTAILLMAGQLRSDLRPDDVFGVSLARALATNDQTMLIAASTARDAFMWTCPSWYQKASEDFVPAALINQRINLMAALDGYYVLPCSTENANLAERVLQTLRVNWKRQRIAFPRSCQVVLCHAVQLQQWHSVSAYHAGLLFSQTGGYTYIEKDSGCGPFVRLDFKRESALFPWLAAKCDMRGPEEDIRFFVTFNGDRIEELKPNGTSNAHIKVRLFEPNQHLQGTPR
jgi:hypothetical protein